MSVTRLFVSGGKQLGSTLTWNDTKGQLQPEAQQQQHPDSMHG